MRFEFETHGNRWVIDTEKSIDLSIAVDCQKHDGAKAWYIDPPRKSPVRMGDWVGSVAQGGSVNFNDLMLNPHAHGTHTESLGHISPEEDSVEGLFKEFFFEALVVSVPAAPNEGISRQSLQDRIDFVLQANERTNGFWGAASKALILRTLPNELEKLSANYDHKGWPFLSADAAQFLADIGVMHLLIDTPSVDPEKDQGALLAHKAFWQWPEHPRQSATITEFIYVPNKVNDGPYLLELQTAAIVNDATFSRPLIYALETL